MSKASKISFILLLILFILGIYYYKNFYSVKFTQNKNLIKTETTDFVKNTAKLPTLVEYKSDSGRSCVEMNPIVNQFSKEYQGKVNVQVIDVYKNPEKAIKNDISLVPTFIFLDAEGKQVYKHVGLINKEEIITIFNEFGVQ